MKVSELPEGTDLRKVLVVLPDNVYEQYINYAGGEKEMYPVGPIMGDWFLSPVEPNPKGDRRLYPMPLGVSPSDISNWEVKKIIGENGTIIFSDK